TDDGSYATLFFADYDDSTRRLRYVNCGHLPPLLFRTAQTRSSGKPVFEKLAATATVLGLFESWDCEAGEAELAPDDILVLYTDGGTESSNGQERKVCENRFTNCLCKENLDEIPSLEPATLNQKVMEGVGQFAKGEQSDDITLVIARCRAG